MPKQYKRVVDPATDVEFVEVPGGTVQLGLRPAERTQLAALIGDDDDGGAELLDELPRARKVKVAPFRVSRAPLDPIVVASAGIGAGESFGSEIAHVSAKEAAKALAALGYRLLTDDEWEYVARGGGDSAWLADPNRLMATSFGKRGTPLGWKKNAFGIDGLGWGSWVRPTKGNLPTVAAGGGLRSVPWQSRGEVAMIHAAFRTKEGVAPLLVAWDGDPSKAKPRKTTPSSSSWTGDVHTATQLRFVDIPGGTFEMGIDKKERARITALLPADLRAAFAKIAAQCPKRKVTVAPFRCATSLVTVEMSKRLGSDCSYYGDFAHNSRKVTDKWAKRFGLRLLTEEEWEYVARDGGARSWGPDLETQLARFLKKRSRKPHVNGFGIAGMWSGTFVGTGVGIEMVSRALADLHYNDRERLGDDIKRLRRSGDEWLWSGALFAVDESPS